MGDYNNKVMPMMYEIGRLIGKLKYVVGSNFRIKHHLFPNLRPIFFWIQFYIVSFHLSPGLPKAVTPIKTLYIMKI